MVRPRAAFAFLALGVLFVATIYALPHVVTATSAPLVDDGPPAIWANLIGDVVYSLAGMAGAAAVVVGVWRNNPARRAPWLWLAAGIGVWSIGDTVYSWREDVMGDAPFPSVADVIYTSAYPLFAIGLVMLARSRRDSADLPGLIDSLIFTVGLAHASWVFLMYPAVADSTTSAAARTFGFIYPLTDVLLLGVLVRLLTSGASRRPSFIFLAAAGLMLLAADSLFSVATIVGADWDLELSALWLGSYFLWGAAALHPSMRGLAQPAERRAVRLSGARLGLLTAAACTPPAVLAIQLVRGEDTQPWSVVISSVVMFLLVVARMAGLMRRIEIQSAQLADLAQTDPLTGLPNRRGADAMMQRALAESTATDRPVFVALIDLDHFKAFNDRLGHSAGDDLLASVASAWARTLAGRAFVGRFGGEEFVAIRVGGTLDEAEGLLHQMSASMPDDVTFSAGLAQWDGVEDVAALLQRADVYLYRAKADGRNRVVRPDTHAPPPPAAAASE